MSYRKASGLRRIESHSVLRDLTADVRIDDGIRLDQIDRTPEDRFQRALQAKIRLVMALRRHRLEADEKIKVAPGQIKIITRRGPEQLEPGYPVIPAKTP